MGRKKKEDAIDYEEDVFKVEDDIAEPDEYVDLESLLNTEITDTEGNVITVGDAINKLHKDDATELFNITKKALERHK